MEPKLGDKVVLDLSNLDLSNLDYGLDEISGTVVAKSTNRNMLIYCVAIDILFRELETLSEHCINWSYAIRIGDIRKYMEKSVIWVSPAAIVEVTPNVEDNNNES